MSPAVSSGKSMQYPSSNASGRGQIPNQGRPDLSNAVDAATSNPLIGRKVRTRWPDDNNFYEAVITEYNPVEVWVAFYSSYLSETLNMRLSSLLLNC